MTSAELDEELLEPVRPLTTSLEVVEASPREEPTLGSLLGS
jgi:hypothetical protein